MGLAFAETHGSEHGRSAGWLLLTVALAGCSFFPVPPSGAGKPEAMRHPDKKFFVQYGATSYLVDVRYIDILGESVIAVRRSAGPSTEPRETLEVLPTRTPPAAETGFADEAYRSVAVDIADTISGRPPICIDGQTMRLARGEDQPARTLYRAQRAAWVVFAFCPPPAAG
ncbi:MAG: hypothetical protein ACFBRM_10425 [Pikeienuella sp.]